MERMEVDQCAGAAAGALRRSISAPMITSVSERMIACSPVVSLRQRRVSINCSCPSQDDNMEASLQGNPAHRLSVSCQLVATASSQWQQCPLTQGFSWQESSLTPNSSPSLARRAVGGANIRWPALTPLKRKGGAESDSPPKKLFVAGVLDPANHSRYALSTSAADSTRGGGGPLLSPPNFTSFTTHPPH